MKRTEPLRVDAIIRQAMDQCGATHTFRQQQICFLWAEIVGPSITRCTIAVGSTMTSSTSTSTPHRSNMNWHSLRRDSSNG